LSLKIYLDDCASAKELVARLRAAGHQVQTPAEASTAGIEDALHLQHAAREGYVLLTRDADDFAALHAQSQEHAGILAVCQDNDPNRDMTYAEIVRAIANLEAARVAVAKAYHVLNAWRY
jgi:hypothetical protein